MTILVFYSSRFFNFQPKFFQIMKLSAKNLPTDLTDDLSILYEGTSDWTSDENISSDGPL